MTDALQMLNQRRSVPARQLGLPGPDADQLQSLLAASIRVPDHGKRVPWRMLVLQGEAKQTVAARLLALLERKQPDIGDAKRLKEQQRYSFAPLVIVVVARLGEDEKIPEQERLLSAGCVAYNLLLGAQALGFGAQWLTGWAAYDRDAADLLGLAPREHVIGFVHVGTAQTDVPERSRPELADVVQAWTA